MENKKKSKEIKVAVYITCRSCGCEYLEDKEWIIEDFKSECPVCGKTLVIS